MSIVNTIQTKPAATFSGGPSEAAPPERATLQDHDEINWPPIMKSLVLEADRIIQSSVRIYHQQGSLRPANGLSPADPHADLHVQAADGSCPWCEAPLDRSVRSEHHLVQHIEELEQSPAECSLQFPLGQALSIYSHRNAYHPSQGAKCSFAPAASPTWKQRVGCQACFPSENELYLHLTSKSAEECVQSIRRQEYFMREILNMQLESLDAISTASKSQTVHGALTSMLAISPVSGFSVFARVHRHLIIKAVSSAHSSSGNFVGHEALSGILIRQWNRLLYVDRTLYDKAAAAVSAGLPELLVDGPKTFRVPEQFPVSVYENHRSASMGIIRSRRRGGTMEMRCSGCRVCSDMESEDELLMS